MKPEVIVPDPNWLMSTAAQSAAALVAIVGGFLVSRVISLTGDRRTSELRLAEARNRVPLLEERLDQAKKALAEWDAIITYDEMLRNILTAKGNIGYLEMLLVEPAPRRNDAAVMELIKPRLEAIRRAFELLEPLFVDSLPTAEQVREIVTKHGRRRPMSQALESVYEHLVEVHEKKEREAQRKDSWLPTINFDPSDIVPAVGLVEQRAKDDRRMQLLGTLENAENALADQLADQALAARIVDQTAKSEGVWAGFGVLSVFAVTGIVVPLWTIGLQIPTLSSAHRAWLVTAFLSGLVLLFGYLGVITSRLKQQPESQVITEDSSREKESDREATEESVRQG